MKLRHIHKRSKFLGRFNKELWIRLVNKGRSTVTGNNHYHIVLARRRNKARSRYTKLGYVDTVKRMQKTYHEVGCDIPKFKQALKLGAKIHIGVFKILIC